MMAASAVIFYAKTADDEPKPKSIPAGKTLTMQATAFCEYGWDNDGLDYGPGYCIVSSKGEIPRYSLLEIDQYGEAQAVAVLDDLSPDRILIWYNAPSKVPMFGEQEVKVKIKGRGDKPCSKY